MKTLDNIEGVDFSPLEKVEGLMDVKERVIVELEEVGMGPEYGSSMEVDIDAFDQLGRIVMGALEELKKYQKENEVLKKQLKNHEENE